MWSKWGLENMNIAEARTVLCQGLLKCDRIMDADCERVDGQPGPGFISKLQQDGGTCWGVGNQRESQGKSSSSTVTVYAAIKEGGGEGEKD